MSRVKSLPRYATTGLGVYELLGVPFLILSILLMAEERPVVFVWAMWLIVLLPILVYLFRSGSAAEGGIDWIQVAERRARAAPPAVIRRPAIFALLAVGMLLVMRFQIAAELAQDRQPAVLVVEAIAFSALWVLPAFLFSARALPTPSGWRAWGERLRIHRPLAWCYLASPHYAILPLAITAVFFFGMRPEVGHPRIRPYLFLMPTLMAVVWYGWSVPRKYRHLRSRGTDPTSAGLWW